MLANTVDEPCDYPVGDCALAQLNHTNDNDEQLARVRLPHVVIGGKQMGYRMLTINGVGITDIRPGTALEKTVERALKIVPRTPQDRSNPAG